MKNIDLLITKLKEAKEDLSKGVNTSYKGEANMNKMEEPHKDDPEHEKKEQEKAKKIKSEAQEILDMHKSGVNECEVMKTHANGQWSLEKAQFITPAQQKANKEKAQKESNNKAFMEANIASKVQPMSTEAPKEEKPKASHLKVVKADLEKAARNAGGNANDTFNAGKMELNRKSANKKKNEAALDNHYKKLGSLKEGTPEHTAVKATISRIENELE